MNKAISVCVAVIAFLAAGSLYLLMRPAPATAPAATADSAQPADPPAFDAANATFTLDGQSVSLKNGVSSIPSAPGSASTTTTRHIGREGRGDLNNDGQDDVAFIVTQDGGGSGLFYYAVAAIRTADGYRTTNGFPIGDRIASPSVSIPRNANALQVAFTDRQPTEPMAAPPSVERVLVLKVTPQGVLEALTE